MRGVADKCGPTLCARQSENAWLGWGTYDQRWLLIIARWKWNEDYAMRVELPIS
jgi:hypothetical protein